MNNAVTSSECPLPDRDNDLARLAQCANEAHNKVAGAVQQAVLHALEAGQALLEAKRLCGKGAWTAWLKAHFRASARTARGYMRLVVCWDQVGGDRQRAADLSQRQLERLLKGFSCSDGRANTGRPAAQKRLTSKATAQNDASAPVPAASITSQPAAQLPVPAAASGDPFGVVAHLLEQTVAELRRMLAIEPDHARYARHLMQPLERIRCGIAQRRWFWDMIKR